MFSLDFQLLWRSWETGPHRWRAWWWWMRPPWQLGLQTRGGCFLLQNISQGPLFSLTICRGRRLPHHRTNIYLCLGYLGERKIWGRGKWDQPPLAESLQTQRASSRAHTARPALGTSAPDLYPHILSCKMEAAFPLYSYLSCCFHLRWGLPLEIFLHLLTSEQGDLIPAPVFLLPYGR